MRAKHVLNDALTSVGAPHSLKEVHMTLKNRNDAMKAFESLLYEWTLFDKR